MDPLTTLAYLVGTWTCTYNNGTQHIPYTATYAYVMDKNWLRERDAWAGGGGSDVGLTTYDPKEKAWTEIVAESERSTTVFRATGSSSAHRVYHSVLPNEPMTLTFDRVSDTKYTLHFNGVYGGKAMTSHDTCTKH